MDFDLSVKLGVYHVTAESGALPSLESLARRIGAGPAEVKAAWARLQANRLLLLGPQGDTIRMAPPFSGVPTQHRVIVDGIGYYANCAWDALGIPAALHRPGRVYSRCEQSREPLDLEVGLDGPGPSSWVFHSLVPAAHWWDDLVFT